MKFIPVIKAEFSEDHMILQKSILYADLLLKKHLLLSMLKKVP